ncbi:MAG: NAD-dependent epimerase/dehydratase family protein [Pseudomonadota bacterium]|nr:NAD-dependent epimerase/dehydratase family protein [Pseudomonadota bacterium]
MKEVLILGLGHVGKALAGGLRAEGVWVKGTTTTPAKVEELGEYADEVHVVRGTDSARIREIAGECDAIISTVAPNEWRARSREEREATYRDVLVASCESAVAANKRVLFLSSFSVYGDGGQGNEVVTEETPVSTSNEPSTRYYSEAERIVLSTGQGCVLRLPDIYGAPGDMSYAQRAKLAHEVMAGKDAFSADARLYVIHFLDVVGAAAHALRKKLTGVYNVCDNQWLPNTNAEVFDQLCTRQDLPKLEFLGEIQTPTCMISAEKLFDTGYCPQYTDLDHPLR